MMPCVRARALHPHTIGRYMESSSAPGSIIPHDSRAAHPAALLV